MSVNDSIFNNLRQKLDVFGYKQALPLSAIPLVSALFEDLVKTTESLRDAKKEIAMLLEEKNCWDLGVEPYKCDNQRLLAECNQLHLLTLKQQEDFERRACEYNRKIRNLQTDKFHLEEQCTQLQQQIQTLANKQSGNLVMGRDAVLKLKKPFVSTVRQELPPLQPLGENHSNLRCAKCNIMGCTQRTHGNMETKAVAAKQNNELIKLENTIRDLNEQLAFYKEKVESRDREILRLSDLLTGGRPPAALAKDCCYKQVGALAHDLEMLQREKTENLNQLRSYQDKMHEAMQRAMKLETINRQLRIDLDEFKKAALQIEQQANADVAKREREVDKLKSEIRKLMQDIKKAASTATAATTATNLQRVPPNTSIAAVNKTTDTKNEQTMSSAEKRQFQEQINILTQREMELKASNQDLHKKMHKLKTKLMSMRKELKDNAEQKRCEVHLDEEKIRLKSERDFFQKEYLRLISKTGSEKEIEFLQQQNKSKDEELRILRTELCLRQELQLPTTPPTEHCTPYHAHAIAATGTTTSTTMAPISLKHSSKQQQHDFDCDNNYVGVGIATNVGGGDFCTITPSIGDANCVQAVVLRVERERDVIRAELQRVRCERDMLREKHVYLLQAQNEEAQRVQKRFDELNERIRELERENREANSARLPSETQNVLLKEEIEELRQRLNTLQEENCALRSSNNQLKVLQEQTERSLLECQNKLTLAEHQLESADLRLNNLDSNRETSCAETTQLRSEIATLKQTYISLEREKDALLAQLDMKTQRACELEYELRACREKRDLLEMRVNELETKFEKVTRESCERYNELQATCKEAKKLRQQLEALRRSRDEAIAENGGLMDNCSDIKAENQRLRKEVEEQVTENEALKKKITQYVQEIRKTEELLLRKEKEREEMLEQYRSLSQDTVALQGNNHSLEEEAAEYKRQVVDYEQEICALKSEIKHRNDIIDEMKAKISKLTERNINLQHLLEEAQEEKHLLKLDLNSRTELCKRLEDERTKLNAEIDELNNALRTQSEKDTARHAEKAQRDTSAADDAASRYEFELQSARLELAEQMRLDQRLNGEIARLRKQNESLMEELEEAQNKNLHCEKLIHEYFVQNQELRHNLTDDRFRQARMREQHKQKATNSSRDNTLGKSLTSHALSPTRACTSRSSKQNTVSSNEQREIGVGSDISPKSNSYRTTTTTAQTHTATTTFRKHTNTPEMGINKNAGDDASVADNDAASSYRSTEKPSSYAFQSKTM